MSGGGGRIYSPDGRTAYDSFLPRIADDCTTEGTEVVRKILAGTGGNVSETARIAGISRHTVRRARDGALDDRSRRPGESPLDPKKAYEELVVTEAKRTASAYTGGSRHISPGSTPSVSRSTRCGPSSSGTVWRDRNAGRGGLTKASLRLRAPPSLQRVPARHQASSRPARAPRRCLRPHDAAGSALLRVAHDGGGDEEPVHRVLLHPERGLRPFIFKSFLPYLMVASNPRGT